MKAILKKIPVVGFTLLQIRRHLRRQLFKSSSYWDGRYRKGGTSGAGSYGDFARFKAVVINRFVVEHEINSVTEFGCGDGNQLSLMEYPSYVGLDVSPVAIDLCREKFKGDKTKHFALSQPCSFPLEDCTSDLSLSLDVIYHLVEDDVFESYMAALFDSADRFVIIYSDDREATAIDLENPHVRHRQFSRWITANRPQWTLLKHIPNRFPFDEKTQSGSWADFWIYAK